MSGSAPRMDTVIWWHVYPLGFTGAPIREPDHHPEPRLRRLLPWLDYAADLGADGLLLGPIFSSATHGYDSLDQFSIDQRLGTDADFAALADACHERGLRIMLDGVFSHVSARHPEVLRALHEGETSSAAAIIDIDWHAEGGPRPRCFEGHESLVRLNHASQAAAEYAAAVMTHWLGRGADGWRLDAAYSVDAAFWRRALPLVRAEFPDAWFLGEVIHGDYPAFVTETGIDTVTQYELWKAIWSSLRSRNLFELEWSLRRHNGFLATTVPSTFVGNHDVTRIASAVGEAGSVTAAAILLTVGGIPAIYAGDEQGFTGVKEERIGGDDAVRPPFPAGPAELAPWGRPIHLAHRQLIAVRRSRPWLTTALTETVTLANTRYVYRSVAADGSAHLTVDIDLDRSPAVTIRDSDGALLWQG